MSLSTAEISNFLSNYEILLKRVGYCATSPKDAGWIPVGLIWFFHWLNLSDPIRALRSTQPLTEISSKNLPWGIKRPVRGAVNLATFMCRLSRNSRSCNLVKPQESVRASNGIDSRLLKSVPEEYRSRFWEGVVDVGRLKSSEPENVHKTVTMHLLQINPTFFCN
jgi:hypothetical protein